MLSNAGRRAKALATSSVVVMGMASLLVLPTSAHAQSLPERYQITARLKPVVLSPAPNEVAARFLNERGEVGGWVSQPAGSVWRWQQQDQMFPFPLSLFFLPRLVSFPQINAMPVTWTGDTPKVWPRYKGNTSAWAVDFADDDTLLTVAAPKTGTVDRDYGFSNLAYDEPPFGSVPLWLRNGQYTAVPNALESGRRMWANRRGTIAGQMYSRLVLVRSNGEVTEIPRPAGLRYFSIRGINDNDVVLLHGGRDEPISPSRCFLWDAGRLTELPVPPHEDRVVDMTCAAVNNAGMVAGVLSWSRISAEQQTYATAVFRYRNGAVEATPYDTTPSPGYSGLTGRMFIDATGLVVFNKDLAGAHLFDGGTLVPLAPRIVGAGVPWRPEVRDMNEAGQMLVDGVVANASLPVVITPER